MGASRPAPRPGYVYRERRQNISTIRELSKVVRAITADDERVIRNLVAINSVNSPLRLKRGELAFSRKKLALHCCIRAGGVDKLGRRSWYRASKPCLVMKNPHRGTVTMRERRKHPRYGLADGRVWTGRWSGSRVFESSACLVDNLSLGGARLLTCSPPVVGEDLWIRSAHPGKEQSLRAEVLEVQKLGDGDYQVRLRFDTSCSEPFVLCLLLGDTAPGANYLVSKAVSE